MKKIIGMMCVLLSAISAFALTPPLEVKKTFDTKFPKATNVKWGKESATEWEADFILNGEKISANFALDGAWLETEEQIKITALPKAVSDAIKSKYPKWTVTEADKTETSKNGSVYEADLKMGSLKKEVIYKADGTFVKE